MSNPIHCSDLQVDGSSNLAGNLTVGGTLLAVAHPTGSQDYLIDLQGSLPTSPPPVATYLKVNQQPVTMDNSPGINTVILNPNGTFKTKVSHNVSQDATQWNSWADWVNTPTKVANGDVVAVATYGAPALPPPPGGSAMALLAAIHATDVVGRPLSLALLFIKGQAKSLVHVGFPCPGLEGGSYARLVVAYHQLLKPYSGNVGINTSEPDANLHVVGNLLVDGKGRPDALVVQGGYTSLIGNFAVSGGDGRTKVLIDESGNVGIGTAAPSHKFHVLAQDAVGLLESSGDQAYLRLSTKEGLDNRVEITNRPGGRFTVWTAGGSDQFNITRDGNVGIGTEAPQAKLHVQGDISASGNVGIGTVNPKSKLDVQGDISASGNVGIGTVTPAAKLHVQGDIIATGDIVLQNADCAEEFAVKDVELIEPGTVMVLGEEGSLCQSTHAYDKKVAGVISGAGDFKPGLILDKQAGSTGRRTISLMGKAYCKVDAQYAAIEVGDLLTTSPTSGHAMKATDPLRAFGATIGKALRPLAEGTGLIPILVALQ